MSNWAEIYGGFFTRALKLYPREFRAEFGDEMSAVFTQAIEAHAGTGKTLRYFLRELKAMPGSVMRQHWLAVRRQTAPMNTLTESSRIRIEDRQPGALGVAVMAGLPHLLMGLLLGFGKLGVFDLVQVSQTGTAIIGIGLALLVLGVLVFAWRRGWPLWGASWYLYGTWVSVVIIGLTIESSDLEESWRYTNAMFFGWILLCVIGYLAILSKSKLHGLLSAAVLFPMLSVMMLEFVPNPIEGWVAIGVGLLAALAAGVVVRVGELRLGLGLVLGLNLTVGLV